jgi:hypothetical protein
METNILEQWPLVNSLSPTVCFFRVDPSHKIHFFIMKRSIFVVWLLCVTGLVSAGCDCTFAGQCNNNCDATQYCATCTLAGCQAVPAGKYVSSSCDHNPVNCPVGTYSPGSQQNCNPCPAGTFIEVRGSTACSTCFAGFFSNSGMSSCLGCSPGFFAATTGLSSCSACSPGFRSSIPLGNSTTCSSCAIGRFTNQAASSRCNNCPGGFFSNSTQLSSCYTCEPGRYRLDGISNPNCSSCEMGKFQVYAGKSFCSSCLEGSYSSLNGSTSCSNCNVGEYSASGVSRCSSCPQGRFNSISGSACSDCPSGKYSDQQGQTACQACPGVTTTQFSGAADSSACVCPDGYYGDTYIGIPCKPCVFTGSRITCPVGTILPVIGNGYFRNQEDLGKAVMCWPSSACPVTGQNVITVCSTGYTGYACSSCVFPTHFRSGLDCKNCPLLVFRVLAILAVTLILLVVMYRMISSPIGVIPEMKVMMNSLQIIALYSRTPVKWIGLMASLINLASVTNLDFDIFTADCFQRFRFWSKFYLRFFLPHIFAYAIIGLTSLRLFLRKKPLSDFKNQAISFWIAINVGFYALFMNTLLEPFRCLRQSDDVYVSASDPSTKCFDAEWKRNLIFVIPTLFFYLIVFPLGLGFVLRSNRRNLDTEKGLVRYGFLIRLYKSQFYFWDIVVMLKRAFFFVSLNFFTNSESANSKTFFSIAVIFIFLSIQIVCSPYNLRTRNVLSNIWDAICVMILVAGACLFDQNISMEEQKKWSLLLGLGLIVFAAFNATLIIKIGLLSRLNGKIVVSRRNLQSLTKDEKDDVVHAIILSLLRESSHITVNSRDADRLLGPQLKEKLQDYNQRFRMGSTVTLADTFQAPSRKGESRFSVSSQHTFNASFSPMMPSNLRPQFPIEGKETASL